MYKKSLTHYIAKWIVEIMFYGGIVCTALVPFFTDDIMRFYYLGTGNEIIYTVILFFSGILAVYVLYYIKKMYKTLLEGNPFIEENVSAFRKMAVACALIFVIFVIKTVLLFTLASAVIALIFAVVCLFCLTLKDLFKQAINYKIETELTI